MRTKFTTTNRINFYLNESTTIFKLISLLSNSHFVLQDSNTSLPYRSLPNIYCKSISVLLFNYLITHSAIQSDKLAHKYQELLQSIHNSIISRTKQLDSIPNDIPTNTSFDNDISPINQQKDTLGNLINQQSEPSDPIIQHHDEKVNPLPPKLPLSNRFSCQTCSISFNTVILYRSHLRSSEHQQNLRSTPQRQQEQPLKEVTNPLSLSLDDHFPSSLRFSSESCTDKDNPCDDQHITKIDDKYFENTTKQKTFEVNYEEHHDNGIVDFKYGQDLDDNFGFPSASQNTRKGQRRLSTDHSERSRSSSKQKFQNNSQEKIKKNNDFDSNSRDNEYDEQKFDNNCNNKTGNISNKVGTTIIFASYPSDPQQTGQQSFYITTTSHHQPQNIILTSPLLGTILIPASSSTFSNLEDENHNSDTFIPPKCINKNNKIIQASLYHLFRLCVQTHPVKNTVIPTLTAIIMDSGGKCALSIWLGQVIIYHRGFQNYTTRKKQGGSQISHEKSGGRTNTAGGQIRSQQTNRHNERLREMLYHLRGELACCQQILLYIPSIYTRDQLFMSKEQQLKWSQSGGVWIGQNSVPLDEPSSLQRSLEAQTENHATSHSPHSSIQHRFFDDSDSNETNENSNNDNIKDDEILNQQLSKFSPNHAFFSTQRDLYKGTVDEPFPISSAPLATSIPIVNWGYYLRQKYSSAFSHVKAHHRVSIDVRTGEYQMAYFQRLNKKTGKHLELLTIKNSSNDVSSNDDDDIEHTDHSITDEWHKDTLIYHYNHTASVLDQVIDNNQNISPKQNNSTALSHFDQTFQTNTTPTSDYNNKKVIFVDQFLPHSPLGESNINYGRFQVDPTAAQPPEFLSTLQFPLTANQQIKFREDQHNENAQLLSSFLEPKQVATVSPSTYSIQPYHPHFIRASYTPQHEYLYLFHRNDPRIRTLSLNVHDAKHDEMLRVYQHMMLCRIKPLNQHDNGPSIE